jgi:S1-C subfamily serine protease
VITVNGGGSEDLCRTVSASLKNVFVSGQPFTEVRARRKGYGFMISPSADGTINVQDVGKDSIAAAAALRSGDVILSMNGRPTATMPDQERFAALRGPSLTLKVRRSGHVIEIRMQLPK